MAKRFRIASYHGCSGKTGTFCLLEDPETDEGILLMKKKKKDVYSKLYKSEGGEVCLQTTSLRQALCVAEEAV